jgi:hypothetical protein
MRKSFEIVFRRLPLKSLVIASGLLAVSAPAAHAQFFNFIFGNGGLQSDDIESMLQDRGLELMGPLHRNGTVYIADVEGPRGGQFRLIIDARDGRIVQRFRMGQRRYEADLGLPRPPAEVGQDGTTSSAIGAPPAVITFGDSAVHGDDNSNGMPARTGDESIKAKPKPQAKHKKIELTPVATPSPSAPAPTTQPLANTAPASQPAASTPTPTPPVAPQAAPPAPSKPPVQAEASPAPAEAKAAAVAPAAPSPPPAPAPQKLKPAINDVPVNPLD